MKQNRKIADFLGEFVRGDGKTGYNSQLNIGEKGGRNQDAVDEIMDSVAQ